MTDPSTSSVTATAGIAHPSVVVPTYGASGSGHSDNVRIAAASAAKLATHIWCPYRWILEPGRPVKLLPFDRARTPQLLLHHGLVLEDFLVST